MVNGGAWTGGAHEFSFYQASPAEPAIQPERQEASLLGARRAARAGARLMASRWAFRASGEDVRHVGDGDRYGAPRVASIAFVRYAVLQWHSAGPELEAPHLRGIKPSALRLSTIETSMKADLRRASDVASDHAAPRCARLRSVLGIRYAERVWPMQAFGLVGRMEHRSTLHHRPNPAFNRTRRYGPTNWARGARRRAGYLERLGV